MTGPLSLTPPNKSLVEKLGIHGQEPFEQKMLR